MTLAASVLMVGQHSLMPWSGYANNLVEGCSDFVSKFQFGKVATRLQQKAYTEFWKNR